MTSTHKITLAVLAIALALAGVTTRDVSPAAAQAAPAPAAAHGAAPAPAAAHSAAPAGHAAMPAATAPAATTQPPAPKPGHAGKVIETMNTSGYTYIRVDTGTEKIWVAAPEFTVHVGDQVALSAGVQMPQYHSKTLNRTFDLVYFTSVVTVNGAAPAAAGGGASAAESMPASHGGAGCPSGETTKPTPVKLDFTGIRKAQGGQTVAEVHAGKAGFAGKQVLVRGKVLKFSSRILGKNWFHLQDGTGASGSNELVVSTAAVVKDGDTALVRGTVVLNRASALGMKMPMVVEDAEVKVE